MLVLAAGAASRFGSPKSLAAWGQRGLLAKVLATANEATKQVPWLVLGAHAVAIETALRGADCHYRRLWCPQWSEGLSSSLKFALREITREVPTVPAILVLLGDQPAVSAADLQRLLGVWLEDPEQVVAAECAGQPSAPCILPRRLFAAIQSLEGDQGARQLLRQENRLRTIPMPGAAYDVDTPADLELAWSRFGDRGA